MSMFPLPFFPDLVWPEGEAAPTQYAIPQLDPEFVELYDSWGKLHLVKKMFASTLEKTNFRGPIPDVPDHPNLGQCWISGDCFRDKKKRRYKCRKLGGAMWYSHRLAYRMWVGPIDEGMDVDHKCRTTTCINPYHLQQRPRADNSRDGHGRGDVPAERMKCPRGHSIRHGDPNTYIEPKTGHRQCTACKAANSKRYATPEYKAAKAARESAVVEIEALPLAA